MKRYFIILVLLLGVTIFYSCSKRGYTITVVNGEGGSAGVNLLCNGVCIEDSLIMYPGMTVTLLAVPDTNYVFERWIMQGDDLNAVAATKVVTDTTPHTLPYTYTFVMPKCNVSFKAIFRNPWLDQYSISPTAQLISDFPNGTSFHFIDAKSGKQLEYNRLIVNGKEVAETQCTLDTHHDVVLIINGVEKSALQPTLEVTFLPKESILKSNDNTITYALDEKGKIASRVVYTSKSVLKYDLTDQVLSVSEVDK